MAGRHFAVLFVLSAACGSVDPSDMPPDAGSDPTGDAGGPDGTAPAVATVTPPDRAAGVRADAEIVLVFSEPMDRASVQAAWTSTDLPVAAVAFTWNAAHDTLTVTPSPPLVLATGTGTDPSVVVPRAYAFGLDATATDASGMPLAAPLASSFTTTRRMIVDAVRLGPLTRTVRNDGVVLLEGTTARAVGDTSADQVYRTFVAFALPDLPDGVELEAATFSAEQGGSNGLPYGLGFVGVDHVNTATLDAAAFAAAPLAVIGTLSTNGTPGTRTLDVTAAFGDDLANAAARGDRSQYRLAFTNPTDNDQIADNTNFDRNELILTVTYLAD